MKLRRNIIIAIFVFIFIFLIAFQAFPPVPLLANSIQKIWTGAASNLYSLKINIFSSESKELHKVRDENFQLLKKLADYNQLKKDNDALRSQFENTLVKTSELLPSRVVGYSGRINNPEVLFIDKGKNDGVVKGMTVIYDDILVGKIQEVSEGISRVILLTNSQFTLLGKTSTSNATGILRGEEDFLVFDNVAITDSLKKGDLVLTKSESLSNHIITREGIIIGKIDTINKSENKPFQTAKVTKLIDYSKVSLVFVLK